MKKIYFLFIIIVALLSYSSIVMSFDLPTFKIIWKQGSTYGILFDGNLSDSQIEQIIYAFRDIRERGEFDKYFPATSPDSDNQYSDLQIQIFTDPKWATKKMADTYNDGHMSYDMTHEYLNNSRGYYGLREAIGYESGTLGDKKGKYKSKNYKILF